MATKRKRSRRRPEVMTVEAAEAAFTAAVVARDAARDKMDTVLRERAFLLRDMTDALKSAKKLADVRYLGDRRFRMDCDAAVARTVKRAETKLARPLAKLLDMVDAAEKLVEDTDWRLSEAREAAEAERFAATAEVVAE